LATEAQAAHLAVLTSCLPGEVEVTNGGEPSEDVQVLVSGRPSPESLDALPQLAAVVVPWAGLPAPTRDALFERPHLKVFNLHHNAAATAETALALLLAVAKGTVGLDGAMRKGGWSPRYEPREALQLEGKTALVLGYGEIGKRVARACLGLGMQVNAVKRVARQAFDGDVALYAPSGLPNLWKSSDALLVCLPATAETEGLVGQAALEALREGAIVVNVARGSVVEEEALFRALESGRLFGAGLDVWWHYPKDGEACEPSRFNFAGLPNVVMSPHVGGSVRDTEPARMRALGELVRRILRDDPGLRAVDVALGY